MKFHENSSKGGSGSCSMRTGQTDGQMDKRREGHDAADRRFSQFCGKRLVTQFDKSQPTPCSVHGKCLRQLRCRYVPLVHSAVFICDPNKHGGNVSQVIVSVSLGGANEFRRFSPHLLTLSCRRMDRRNTSSFNLSAKTLQAPELVFFLILAHPVYKL